MLSKPTAKSPETEKLKRSAPFSCQTGLVVIIGVLVFVCESLVMVAIYSMPALSTSTKIFIDSCLLALLLSPTLYFGVFRPMVRNIQERQQAEETLRSHGHHLEDLVKQRTAELSAANETLRQQIRVRTRAENLMQERTFELDDYIRELQCLYAISRLMEKADISIEKLITKTIGLLPFAWLNPESIGVRVTLQEREFKTDGFRQTEWKQAAEILVHGQSIGFIEIAYLLSTFFSILPTPYPDS